MLTSKPQNECISNRSNLSLRGKIFERINGENDDNNNNNNNNNDNTLTTTMATDSQKKCLFAFELGILRRQNGESVVNVKLVASTEATQLELQKKEFNHFVDQLKQNLK